MKVLSVVGARPQFVKLAPVARAARTDGVDHVIVHTGQHYDAMLSDVFFEGLGIPAPDVHLGVGSGSHGVQTGAMLAALDGVIDQYRPDWVLVYGDTNSTLAAAVSAVKQHVPVAHLEAGLRSFNRRMPEEHNRVLTDHAADLLLAPTETAMQHLGAEGLAGRSVLVGDVMTDVLLTVRAGVNDQVGDLAEELGLTVGAYYLATIHRAENTDDPHRLRAIVSALAALDRPVILLAHPRLVARAVTAGLGLTEGVLVAHAPLGYAELIAAVLGSAGVVTDSGGLQKEAFLLGVPCTTVRSETEWVETIDLGWNVLAPAPEDIAAAVLRTRPRESGAAPYGDGHAAERVIASLRRGA
ncbi:MULTISPECIES: UDP-N-acetylglucosamine 2-epimerase (non-hydrolyzing) [unclassified Microbacterium]|uniref:non-hydrolyzing UDP-N-acetylglucosamine 2-epimerase n=1 Tax=unclassified Microbacterium TaxID=2609290 RepID=UPI00214C733C|nr:MULTISPECIES: UDP-N-acetylglucosamine 2-epimerase (non-hydrolyzing) [unclassified Microbacterium]MCR2810259.1 UDP-N-acetylglucosamine 2-epimerase (non-hydrolyzing) [Microbacterium sp. zg.B185]WIM19912.1 UDP-N-acetylglucosamine 2-epimerase (non-hydrolyzing) [Microbacterium sp. zg-B185]